jgi:hypothetical protein
MKKVVCVVSQWCSIDGYDLPYKGELISSCIATMVFSLKQGASYELRGITQEGKMCVCVQSAHLARMTPQCLTGCNALSNLIRYDMYSPMKCLSCTFR